MAEQEESAQPNEHGLRKITLGEDFTEDYANNFTFEFTPWDFKIIFGQTDQMSGQPNDINWHTSITMPWGVAKILSRMLLLNVVAGEMQLGPIRIPPAVMPPPPPDPTEQMSPALHALWDLHKRLYGSLAAMVPEDLRNPVPPPPAPSEPSA